MDLENKSFGYLYTRFLVKETHRESSNGSLRQEAEYKTAIKANNASNSPRRSSLS